MFVATGAIRAEILPNMENMMKRLMTLALTVALAAPAAVTARPTPSIAVNCTAEALTPRGEAPNLHGTWDFVMDVGGTPNFGLLSIGFVGNEYGGSLALWMTAPVILRELTLTGSRLQRGQCAVRRCAVGQGRPHVRNGYLSRREQLPRGGPEAAFNLSIAAASRAVASALTS